MKKIKLFLLLLCTIGVLLCSSGCEILDTFLEEDLSQDERPAELLVSHFIDVGQGDSEFIELPNGETMLIDAGVYDAGPVVTEYIKNLGYSKIDYLVATHPHADHIGGLRAVINEFEIGSVYMPKAETDTFSYEKLLTAIKNKGLKIKNTKAGTNIMKSDAYELSIDVLAPVGSKYESLNDYSVVIRISYKQRRFLYMGDAEALSEGEILKKYSDMQADVIKVGHHGSSTSSSQAFIDAVKAKYAIFSLGKDNDYHHPHQKVVDRWKKAGVTMYRTDERGTITISTDGTKLDVRTEK